MSAKIYPITSGINTCYIIKDKGVIMIDGGPPKMKATFLKKMYENSVDPQEVQMIILTHGDFDHVGSAKEIKKITGAKVAIHEKDRKNLEQQIFNWPKGTSTWGKISRTIFFPLLKKTFKFPKTKADIILDDRDISLDKYGIDGHIIYTPGHTPGSVSVLLNTGEAFVGCLAHNLRLFRMKPGLPIYADNLDLIKQSWKSIIAKGAKLIFPAHGKPFSIEVIKQYIY